MWKPEINRRFHALSRATTFSHARSVDHLQPPFRERFRFKTCFELFSLISKRLWAIQKPILCIFSRGIQICKYIFLIQSIEREIFSGLNLPKMLISNSQMKPFRCYLNALKLSDTFFRLYISFLWSQSQRNISIKEFAIIK